MNNENLLDKYVLTQDEHDKWMKEVILPMFAFGKVSVDQPTFVLLTGQPGAGKSYSSMEYAKKFLREEPVRFGADDLRALLPYAGKVLAENEAQYPFITKKDSVIAREKLVDYAISHRLHILVESILTNPLDYKMGTLMKVKNAGYRIECVALGVHHHVSEAGMFMRYEEQKKISGYGFAPTYEVHNKAYNLMPDIVANMYEHGIADKVSVYNRRFECFYDSDKNDGGSLAIRNAIVRSRNSSLNFRDMADVMSKWENILEYMNNRKAPANEYKVVNMIYENFKKNTGIVFSPLFQKYQQSKMNKS